MLFFLVEIVYEVIPVFYEGIEEALVQIFGEEARNAPVPEMLPGYLQMKWKCCTGGHQAARPQPSRF